MASTKNNLTIGEFRIPGQPRMSACVCAKTRLMRVTSCQEDKQTWKLWQKRTIWNVKRFWSSQNLLTGKRNHCFKQQKENQLVITKKNRTTSITRNWPKYGAVSEFNKNAKMVSKSLNKVILMFVPVMVKTTLGHTFHWSVRTCRKLAS